MVRFGSFERALLSTNQSINHSCVWLAVSAASQSAFFNMALPIDDYVFSIIYTSSEKKTTKQIVKN